jgi:hypothetical protein
MPGFSKPPAVLRLALGVAMFPHGAQKRLLGWFGGNGYSGTMGGFPHMGIPAVLVFLAIRREILGGTGADCRASKPHRWLQKPLQYGCRHARSQRYLLAIAISAVLIGGGPIPHWTGPSS